MTDRNSQNQPPVRATSPPAVALLRVVLVYAAFASLWILLSDKAVAVLFHDPARIILVSTLKGWLFVGVTSLLLFGLMRRLPCRKEPLAGTPAVRLRSLAMPLTLLSLAIVALTGGGIANTLVHQKEKEVARLQAIADLKTSQIADWLKERHGDALFVGASQYWTELYHQWRGSGDDKSFALLRQRLDRYRQNNAFQGILLLDEDGTPLWDSQGRTSAIDPSLTAAVRRAASDPAVHHLGPYRDQHDLLHVDFVAPLPAIDERPAPVVVLRADPAAYLFPTLQSWPVPSPSGDIVLFKRDGDQVLFLNQLRHRADTAVKLRLPVAASRVLAAQVVRGEAGLGDLVEGVDYRGVAVMGVVRAIPGSDWFLVAKLDRAEVFAEATGDMLWIGFAGLLALFVTAIAAFLFRQRQELAFALREREVQAERLKALQLLDSIAASSTDAIYAKDSQGHYLLFNQAAARFAGKIPEAVLGQDDTALLPPDQAARVIDHDRQVMADDRVVTGEEELVTPDGERTFLTTKGPLVDSEGTVIGLFGISRDITERKEAEAALRESEASLARAQAIAHLGSWRHMIQTGELTWSAETCRIFGLPVGSPVTMDLFLAAIHPEDRERVLAVKDASLSTGKPYAVDFRILVNGEVKWVRGQGEVTLDAAGRPLVNFGVLQDITEQKQSEEERERLQTQLLQAQKMESVGRLAGGVAHDFNNMLSVIIGHAELALIREDLPEELVASLKEIEKAAERSAAFTRQLLAFARKQAIVPKVLDLNDTTAGMLKMLRRLIGEDIDLAWMPGAHLWPVRVDPAQVDQILANLAVNARDAITGVGRITIRTENATLDAAYCAAHPSFVPGDFVILTVSDDGCGMEQEVMAQIFDPFFTTKEVGQGTGLGLATVYGIVKQNKGAIDVVSEPGQGTTFRIALPRISGQEVEPSAKRQVHTPRGRGERILLVEDEVSIREVSKSMLERLGYAVQAAETPSEALGLVTSGLLCDLLITDVVMPEMNGRELMERLRMLRPGLKALFMSGYTADIIAQQGALEEGLRFIQKPFSLQDLALQVREVLAAGD